MLTSSQGFLLTVQAAQPFAWEQFREHLPTASGAVAWPGRLCHILWCQALSSLDKSLFVCTFLVPRMPAVADEAPSTSHPSTNRIMRTTSWNTSDK